MSILDDAIREHLELKRAHGADDSELKRLEDEAFGPPQRPDEIDPFAEAPTEFLASPGEAAADAPEIGDEHERSGRRPNLTDLQEAPPTETGDDAAVFDDAAQAPEDEHSPAPDAPPPSPTDAAGVPLPPPPGEAAADLAPPTGEAPADDAPAPPTDEAPASTDEAPASTDEAPAPPTDEPAAPATDEEHTAAEHEIVPDPDSGPSPEERHAIADQPTQMFDVQAQMDAEAGEAPVAGEQASPTDEELVDAAREQPHAAPPAPEEAGSAEQLPLDTRGPDAEVAGHPPAEAEEESAEFDFFNEQRLSDELDQALEAPLPPTDEHIAMPRYEDAPAEGSGIFDFESQVESEREPYEDDPSQEVLRRADAAEAAEEPFEDPPGERTEEAPRPAPEPPSEEARREPLDPPSEETPRGSAEPGSEEDDYDYDPETGHEDVLEDTPRFLEDAPEDDDLWFEQKPPKDFDLD
jgi:hypothetical protein